MRKIIIVTMMLLAIAPKALAQEASEKVRLTLTFTEGNKSSSAEAVVKKGYLIFGTPDSGHAYCQLAKDENIAIRCTWGKANIFARGGKESLDFATTNGDNILIINAKLDKGEAL